MVVVTFRNRLAPGIDLGEYEQRSAKLYEIASAKGFDRFAPSPPRTASASR